MKITKYGHCCMLIEEEGVRILTDPGSFTADTHVAITGIQIIVYTHEHADHFHLASLKSLRLHNPDVHILANPGVASVLAAEAIPHEVVSDGLHEFCGVSIEGIAAVHAEIHSSIPRIQNTGFLIGKRLWYPGDAFHIPRAKPELLALPLAGPWMKVSDAIDYTLTLSPRIALPVHDFILSEAGQQVHRRVAGSVLSHAGIELHAFDQGKEYDL